MPCPAYPAVVIDDCRLGSKEEDQREGKKKKQAPHLCVFTLAWPALPFALVFLFLSLSSVLLKLVTSRYPPLAFRLR